MNLFPCHLLRGAPLRMSRGSHLYHANDHGFSMIEVALAIAVIGIAITSILALMGIAINTSTDARDDNQIGMLASQIVADRSTSPFRTNSALYGIPRLDVSDVNLAIYFGKNGRKLPSSSGAYYAIVTETTVLPPSAAKFDVRVIWPANAARPSTNYFSTIIARSQP